MRLAGVGGSGGSRRLVILAGAPTQSALEQSAAPSQQADSYLPAFRRFFKIGGDGLPPRVGGGEHDRQGQGQGHGDRGPWRELPLKGGGDDITVDALLQLQEGGATVTTSRPATAALTPVATSTDPSSEAQADDGDQAAAAQLLHDDKVAAKSRIDEADRVDEAFLNHSFTCYHTAPLSSPLSSSESCSQIPTISQFPTILPDDSLDFNTLHRSFTTFHTSCGSTTSSDGETAASKSPKLPSTLPPLPPLSSLTDLEDLPSPKELERLQSHSGRISLYHTKPISTIVGIISISQPILCRNGSEMVKLVIGDETASGFGVTIWLDSSLGIKDKLCNGIVRPLDVVLLRNLSMNVYIGKVYLNSMRNKTEVELLYRCGERIGTCGLDLVQEGAFKDQQLEKVRRVVQWIVGFVKGGRSEGGGDQTILPEDTQFEEH